MSQTRESTETHGVEVSHIDVIPPSDRHGQSRDLFPVWFSGNLSIGNAIFGALAIAVGNTFWWAVLAVLVGNVVGGVFMALHSVQGARLGVPQLIQSRGQFGFLGALLPVFLATFLYGGFFVITAVIGGQALSAAMPETFSVNGGLVLLSVLSLGIALLGYRTIHAAARWALWPLAGAVIVATVASIMRGGLEVTAGPFQSGPFFTAVGLMATFLLTYAPYVSDYSRYLPEDSKASACFGWTFGGVFLSATWCNLLGVVLAVQVGGLDVFAATRDVIGNDALAILTLVITAVAIAGNNALNLYGSMLNLITGISSFTDVRPSFLLRLLFLLPTYAIGLFIALRATENFTTDLGTFLSFLMLGFVPWGAINLLDFYLVRHGNYDVPGFFRRSGTVYHHDPSTWTYGGVNLQALIAYVIGVAAAIPFMGNAWYIGSVSERLGGADVSWVPGILVTGAVYMLITRVAGAKQTSPKSVSTAAATRQGG
jgi:NCS1 family nucleobase:cation symporter-1